MCQDVVLTKELSIQAASANLKALKRTGWREGAGMDVHKNARSCPRSRALLVDRVERLNWTVADAAKAAGLSRRRASEFVRRARAGEALEDRSSCPLGQPNRCTDAEREQILLLRSSRMTLRQVAVTVERSLSTVARICRSAGLHRLRSLDPVPPIIRYERDAPGELLHMDIKKLGRIQRPGHRVTQDRRGPRLRAGWEFLHIAIDDHSRVAYLEILPDETGASASAFLRRAVAWFEQRNTPIERVLTDNGGAYVGRAFATTCAELGIRHKRTRPYTPRTNGKAERFIQTTLRECAYRFSFANSAQRRRALGRFVHFYNHHRLHSSLGYNPPISRLDGNNLLRLDN